MPQIIIIKIHNNLSNLFEPVARNVYIVFIGQRNDLRQRVFIIYFRFCSFFSFSFCQSCERDISWLMLGVMSARVAVARLEISMPQIYGNNAHKNHNERR